jgi:PAS domain S-box-containing protein
MPQTLPAADDLFRLVVEEATDFAIFLLDPDGQIVSWNEGAERMFGWSETEVLQRYFGLLFQPSDREARMPERELEMAAATGRATDTRWHIRRDGHPFFADGVTTALRGDAGELLGFSKIARDITDRIAAERRLGAQLALTNILSEDSPVEETARRVMQTICENLGWDVGALWRVDPDANVLTPIDLWHPPTLGPTVRDEIISVGEWAPGVGLPGRVWESGEPAWIVDVTADSNFPRAESMHRLGMRAAFAFPIVHRGRVAAVMEFFRRQPGEPDQALLPAMVLIGAQIGEYFERRQTAEALRLSEEKYRVVSESAQDAIFTIDGQSRVLFTNPAIERIFGYKPSDLIGQHLEVIIPPRLREAHNRGIARYLATGEKRLPWSGFEIVALHRDGHEFPVEVSFGEAIGPGGTIFTGFARDISERKRGQEELKRSLEEAHATRAQLQRRAEEETAFRRLASALSGAVESGDVLHEITSRATTVARADGVYVERVISGTEIEVISTYGRGTPERGTRAPFPGSLTDEILRERAPAIIADMSTGFGKAMAPYLAKSCGDCEVLVAPLFADAEPLGALVLLNSRESGRTFQENDIERARTLGDLASLALRRVRLMENERTAKERAEAAVKVRDETLGIVSHDLRNPLTTIALAASMVPDAPPEEQRDHVETIATAAKQMQRLIQDLLDVARVEAGGLSVQKVSIDARELAGRACDSNRPLAEAKRQTLECEVPELPQICGDRDRLLQVFSNLIGNAIKFTPPGGSITVRGYERRDVVLFEVRDTGPGIPESDVKKVFTPYWQAKKTAHMGAGLGLAIVRGIIEAHGGTVSASNAAGGGAVFTFGIPRV